MEAQKTVEVRAHFEQRESGSFQCTLCPRLCVIRSNKQGWCGARENKNGKLIARTYGLASSVGPDPVEKKPLYHYFPGSATYSIGGIGCNLGCLHCQNWSISTAKSLRSTRFISSEKAVKEAQELQCPSISLTYNEPLIWYEYIIDIAEECKKNDLELILVTNGYTNPDAAEEVSKVINAANIDIKGFTEDFYVKTCKGHLDPVLETARIFKENGVHVETTTLLIPGLNDSKEELRRLVQWQLDTLGPNTPVHFSRFVPHHKMKDRPLTPAKTLETARKLALEAGMKFVYIGNLRGSGNHTYCPKCNVTILKRNGYDIKKRELTDDNKCGKCGEIIPIIGTFSQSRTRGFFF
ncbi:MAG: AmmeMemoRadiSam system radical SAM enzyme [Promethearchaeota archaeon]